MKFANSPKPRQEIRGDGAPGGWWHLLPNTVSCPVVGNDPAGFFPQDHSETGSLLFDFEQRVSVSDTSRIRGSAS
jgi:rubredoxin